MVEFLGSEPSQFVSPETAQAMARAAYRRGLRLRESEAPVVGLACTASIATVRVRKGEHRCCVAAWDDRGVTSYSLTLVKGRRRRAEEEGVVSRLLLHALAAACGFESGLPLGLEDDEPLAVLRTPHDDPLRRLLSSEVETVTVHGDGRMVAEEPFRGGVLAGSFSPLHRGHQGLAAVAADILGMEVAFELSVTNVDKPPLEEAEVRRRLGQFQGLGRVLLTRAETFHKKAAFFPGCVFVMGWDTAVRLVDPRYYRGREEGMLRALAEMGAANCRFLVAGRREGDAFHTLADLSVPQGYEDLFQAIPQSRFRADVSSTELRGESKK
jgi:hypothetical protein